MAFEADEATNPTCETPAAGPAPAAGSVEPESAARESLSWIRALASQWEDDLLGSSPDSREGRNRR